MLNKLFHDDRWPAGAEIPHHCQAGGGTDWANGQSDLIAPYRLKTNRDTAVLKFSGSKIRQMMHEAPLMATALFQRQIWQIGRFQQSSSGLSNLLIKVSRNC